MQLARLVPPLVPPLDPGKPGAGGVVPDGSIVREVVAKRAGILGEPPAVLPHLAHPRVAQGIPDYNDGLPARRERRMKSTAHSVIWAGRSPFPPVLPAAASSSPCLAPGRTQLLQLLQAVAQRAGRTLAFTTPAPAVRGAKIRWLRLVAPGSDRPAPANGPANPPSTITAREPTWQLWLTPIFRGVASSGPDRHGDRGGGHSGIALMEVLLTPIGRL